MGDAMNERNLSTLPNAASREPGVPVEFMHTVEEEDLGFYREPPPPTPGFTLGDVMQVLRQRSLTLLLGALLGLAAVAGLLAWTTPLYAVSAKVVITRQAPGELVDTDSGSSAFIATQAEVMQSPTVVQAAVATLPRPAHLAPEDDAVKEVLDAVHASAITHTRVIALGYMGEDAGYGAALLTAMVDAYVAEMRDTTRSSQAQSLDTKAAELDVLLRDIVRQESRIKELRQINSIIGTADEAAAAQTEQLNDQIQQLAQVRNRRIELESRLLTGGAVLNVDDPVRFSLQEDLRQAEAELAKARLSLTAEHPTIVVAERNVEVLRGQLAVNVEASPSALRQEIAEVARLEAELMVLETHTRGRLADIELHRREENELLAELERTRSLADEWRRELLNQRLVARLTQAGDAGIGARIIAQPAAPDEPAWPKPKLMLPAGLVLGLGGGFVVALVSLRLQRSADVSRGSKP